MTLHHTEIGDHCDLHSAEETENGGSIPPAGFLLLREVGLEPTVTANESMRASGGCGL